MKQIERLSNVAVMYTHHLEQIINIQVEINRSGIISLVDYVSVMYWTFLDKRELFKGNLKQIEHSWK